MSATLDLKGRPLADTLTELQQRVRQTPGDAALRTFLFQLLSVLGQWERAISQLGVAGELDVSRMAMVQMYREALKCEALRRAVFAGERSPVLFGDPDPWVALVLEAVKRSAEGRHDKAQALREEAFEAAPAAGGRVIRAGERGEGDEPPAGEAFEWIADADSRLGPMLEAIVLGRYMWVPIHRIRRLDIEPPADLRDLVWAPAHFEWANGGEAVGLIPTRYPGTETHDDDALRLARRTEWTEAAPGTFHGVGQRILTTDAGEYALLEIARIQFESAPADA